MRERVVSVLKYMIKISNANLTRNADGLLPRIGKGSEVKWIGNNKSRIQFNKFKTTY